MMLNHLGLDCLLPDDDYLIAIKIWSLLLPCIFAVDSESSAKAHSQLLVRQRVIFLVAGSSLVALYFYPQARQGLFKCFYKLYQKVKLSTSPASNQCFFE
jgi:hypothetical protein